MATLFDPLSLRDLTLRNRIVVSPMQQYSSENGGANDWHLVHLGSRAVGGAGLIITESTAVTPEGRSTHRDMGLWDDAQAEPWRRINAFVHGQGARIAVQLGHFGSKGSRSHPNEGLTYLSPAEGGWQTVSSSAVAPFPGMSLPRPLTIAEIQTTIAQFGLAAQRAVAAGFDAIELHGAHGYLIHQFYSELINQRTDAYGGSFANRTRFAREVVAQIRRVIPDRMPLLVRISAVDYVDDPKGWTLEQAVALAQELKAGGVDLITASAGGFVFLDKSKVRPGYQVSFATEIRTKAGLPTGAVGLITAPDAANDIIEGDKADLVVIAREHLRDPYFATHAAVALRQTPAVPFQSHRAYW
ncbi:MAG: NADH:flavin oxidoreductase/NADH oxidase [Ferruginibacter sp.]|nr:NADH:flavin oxidoreductase/NADH oxidase [Cytophagales bacterium]